MEIYSLLISVCFVAVVLFLILRIKAADSKSLIAKTVASFVFVVLGALSLIYTGNVMVKVIFVLGLFCGLIGDIFLDLKFHDLKAEKTYLNFGTLFFGFGHMFYFFGLLIYAAANNVIGFGWTCLATALFSLCVGFIVVKFSKSIKLDLTGFKVQSFFYLSILVFMAIISIALTFVRPVAAVLAVGFTMFLASDLILSLQYFGGKQNSHICTIFNHSFYYLAQILIATFLYCIV